MVNPGFSSQAEAPPPQPQGNGIAVAGMVLGILTVVLFFTSLIAVILGILAIIFSIIGIRKAARVGKGKGMAIAGLVTGIIGTVLAILLVVAIAIPAFTDYMKKSKQSEAGLQLNRLGKRAKIAYGENGEFPKGTVPLTPAAECCSQPGAKCAPSPAEWNNPVWQALDFEVDEPSSYRFDYSSSDGKSFVAHAVGDLDCDGVPATYELDGTIDVAGNPAITLIAPPRGTY